MASTRRWCAARSCSPVSDFELRAGRIFRRHPTDTARSVENRPPHALKEFLVDFPGDEEMEARLVRPGDGEMQQLDERSASESGSEKSSLLCGICNESRGEDRDFFAC